MAGDESGVRDVPLSPAMPTIDPAAKAPIDDQRRETASPGGGEAQSQDREHALIGTHGAEQAVLEGAALEGAVIGGDGEQAHAEEGDCRSCRQCRSRDLRSSGS